MGESYFDNIWEMWLSLFCVLFLHFYIIPIALYELSQPDDYSLARQRVAKCFLFASLVAVVLEAMAITLWIL